MGKQVLLVQRGIGKRMDVLKALDCQYLFSCGVISKAGQLGLELIGYYETEESYWGVLLYEL